MVFLKHFLEFFFPEDRINEIILSLDGHLKFDRLGSNLQSS